MTSNQIAYWQLQETKRANLVNEGVNKGQLAETQRANVAREGIQRDTLAETKRANLKKESQNDRDLDRKDFETGANAAVNVFNSLTGGVKTLGGIAK